MKKKKIVVTIVLSILVVLLAVLLFLKYNKNDKKEVIIQTNKRDETKEQLEVVNESINIRKDTNTKSDILGKIYKGEIYTILESKEDDHYTWYLIETNNKIKGFVAGSVDEEEYVKILENKEKEVID